MPGGCADGTPFFDRVKEEELLREDLLADPEAHYKACDGFAAMVKHPTLRAEEIEARSATFMLRRPNLMERVAALGAVLAAAWTSVRLRLGLGQHPRLVRHGYR